MKKRILLFAAFAMLTLAGWSQAPASPSFDDVLTSRRSIRNYDASKKISEAEVRELMKATQEAPSWANQQPSKYYVAISPEKLAAVQDLTRTELRTLPSLLYRPSKEGSRAFSMGIKQTKLVKAGEHTTTD